MGILCASLLPRRYYIHVHLFFYPTKPRSQSYLIIQFNFLLLKCKEQTTADAQHTHTHKHTSASKYQNVFIHTLLFLPSIHPHTSASDAILPHTEKQNPSRIVPQNTVQHFVLGGHGSRAISSSWMLCCAFLLGFCFFFFFSVCLFFSG